MKKTKTSEFENSDK